jgi:hypothetical protein
MNGMMNKPKFQQFFTEKKQTFEQARSAKIRRIQQDITRIVKREREYTEKLIEEIMPVKISWNEEALKKFKEIMPIKIEPVVKPEDDEGDESENEN